MENRASSFTYISIILICISLMIILGVHIFQEDIESVTTTGVEQSNQEIAEDTKFIPDRQYTTLEREQISPQVKTRALQTTEVNSKPKLNQEITADSTSTAQTPIVPLSTNNVPDTNTSKEVVELSPEDVFLKYVSAAKSCDFTTRDLIITQESKKILSDSCTSWKNEVSCYETSSLETYYSGRQATIVSLPFSQKSMPPFVFIKENDLWKIDFKFMADGIVFTGSGKCAYPWSWRSTVAEKKFCSIADSICQ